METHILRYIASPVINIVNRSRFQEIRLNLTRWEIQNRDCCRNSTVKGESHEPRLNVASIVRDGRSSKRHSSIRQPPRRMIRQNLFPTGAMIRFDTAVARVTAPLLSLVALFSPQRHVFLLFSYPRAPSRSPITLSRSVRERDGEHEEWKRQTENGI